MGFCQVLKNRCDYDINGKKTLALSSAQKKIKYDTMRRPSCRSSVSLHALTGFIAVVVVVIFCLSGGGAVGERAVSSAQRLDLPRARPAEWFRAWRLSGDSIIGQTLP